MWIALARALRDGTPLRAENGTLRVEPTWSFDGLELAEGDAVRRPVTQGRHVTGIVGETLLITLYRRTHAGLNSELELARYLHDAGFSHTAPLLGTIVYDGGGPDGSIGVGMINRYVLNRGNGWDVTQTFLQRHLELRRTQPIPESTPGAANAADVDYFAPEARRAGERLAELHLSLAASTDPAFVPEPIEAEDRAGWVEASLRRAAFVFERLPSRLRGAAPSLRDAITHLGAKQTDLTQALARSDTFDSSWKVRIHGDLHLARFLVTEGDLLIVDPGSGDEFLPPAERRRKMTPLRDVARMHRSFEAAAAAALRSVATDRTEDPHRFERDLRVWTGRAAKAFRDGYAYGVNQSLLDVGDPSIFRFRVEALALHDAVEALAVALAENSSQLGFYVSNLVARLPQ
jgi:maltose alpha-D-glucosyltransferase/alpha-amylase